MQIRPYVEDDWQQVWRILREVVDAGDTYAYDPDWSEEVLRGIWVESPPGVTLVATDDSGAVVGTAKSGPNRPGPGAHIATASFMVAGSARRLGVGRALGSYVVEWAREQGYHGMQFNAVVETNRGAVRLWQELGFRVIGTVPEAFAHPTEGLVGLHVMYREL